MDYTHIDSSNNKWIWSGTTSDGRSAENDDVSNVAKYLYYSTRAGGWLPTATAPDLSAADPWVGNNNQVRFSGQAHGDSPDGVFHDARLYCGHDTGDPAEGCSNHPRGDGRDYYWCDNDGTVTVSCEDVVANFHSVRGLVVERPRAVPEPRRRSGHHPQRRRGCGGEGSRSLRLRVRPVRHDHRGLVRVGRRQRARLYQLGGRRTQ